MGEVPDQGAARVCEGVPGGRDEHQFLVPGYELHQSFGEFGRVRGEVGEVEFAGAQCGVQLVDRRVACGHLDAGQSAMARREFRGQVHGG